MREHFSSGRITTSDGVSHSCFSELPTFLNPPFKGRQAPCLTGIVFILAAMVKRTFFVSHSFDAHFGPFRVILCNRTI